MGLNTVNVEVWGAKSCSDKEKWSRLTSPPIQHAILPPTWKIELETISPYACHIA